MHPLGVTILQRTGLAVVTLFVVSVLIFSALEFLPGDFAEAMLGQSATPEAVAALRMQLGLDRPAVLRYFEWIGNFLHGDLGTSFASRVGSRRAVADMLAPRLYNTMVLACLAAAIAVPLALLLGVLTALYRNSWFDRAVNAVCLTTISVPEFFVAYLLILIVVAKDTFAISEFAASSPQWLVDSVSSLLNALPNFSILADITSRTTLLEQLWLAALPALTLTLVIVAHMMRMARAALLNVLSSSYIEMARLKGLHPATILLLHALPNAWAPIVTVIAFNLAYLIVGVVVVEVVFVYPGVGQLMVDAVRSRDIPVVQACALVFAFTYILLNLVADVLSIASNPRLLHPK